MKLSFQKEIHTFRKLGTDWLFWSLYCSFVSRSETGSLVSFSGGKGDFVSRLTEMVGSARMLSSRKKFGEELFKELFSFTSFCSTGNMFGDRSSSLRLLSSLVTTFGILVPNFKFSVSLKWETLF